MSKKYIRLINQLIQGYHLSKEELDDLDQYLDRQKSFIKLRIKNSCSTNIKLKEYISLDLYNLLVDGGDNKDKLKICAILKERGETELIYSLLINTI